MYIILLCKKCQLQKKTSKCKKTPARFYKVTKQTELWPNDFIIRCKLFSLHQIACSHCRESQLWIAICKCVLRTSSVILNKWKFSCTTVTVASNATGWSVWLSLTKLCKHEKQRKFKYNSLQWRVMLKWVYNDTCPSVKLLNARM